MKGLILVQSTKENGDEVAPLHVLTREEPRHHPEEDGGSHASRGHVPHRGHPIGEQRLGDRHTEAENHICHEDGHMATP